MSKAEMTVPRRFHLLVLLTAFLAVGAYGADTPPSIDMVIIPAGEVLMGSPSDEAGRRGDEIPRTSFTVDKPFALAVTEITTELWLAVMDSTPSYFTACDDCPVESVSWYAALDFCNMLSERDGYDQVYVQQGETIVWLAGADGYRLPTEVEWEYACRAGSVTAFAGGNCLHTDEANYDGTRPQTTCDRGLNRHEPVAVGSFAPNAWGLFDMHGNVSEWCWNTAWVYGTDPLPGPGPTDPGAMRAVRGGGWISHDTGCRSAVRFFISPHSRYDFVGLRLARTLAEDTP